MSSQAFFKSYSVLLFWLMGSLYAQTTADLRQIRESAVISEELVNRDLFYLADLHGPRMMGTPAYAAAVDWARHNLEAEGISTRLHSFDANYVGWSMENFSVRMTAPSVAPLLAYPLAFTRSSEGTRGGKVLVLNRMEDVYAMADSLSGRVLLLRQYYRPVSSRSGPMSQRLDDDILNRAAANPDPNDLLIGYHSRRSIVDVFGRRERDKREKARFYRFVDSLGVVAVIEPSDFAYGILHADGNRALPSFRFRDDPRPLPCFVLANEHFGRLIRLMDRGYQPEIEVNLSTTFYENPDYNVNLIAEIPGSDPELKNEVVLIGAHLDSWHAGTGAVDNAANCVAMLEAMRLIKRSGLRPARTIRLVLWGGEEQVFAGSSAYVNAFVGDFDNGQTKGEHAQLSAYLNLDNGAGKIRGLYLMGNDKIAPYFAEYLEPFPGSSTLTLQNANQTDHELFDYFNVPAFQFIQDPLDYMTAIHHTNMDVVEYVPIEDVVHNAQLIAWLAYRIAGEPERLPRKPFNSPIPSREGNQVFTLNGYQDAQKVNLVGDFNNWDMIGLPLYTTDDGWEVRIDLPPGKYFYKFIVDGYWTSDPATPTEQLTKDGKGHGGLTVRRVE